MIKNNESNNNNNNDKNIQCHNENLKLFLFYCFILDSHVV